MTDERLAIARAFDKASYDIGVGMSLGMWAGRGDWAQLSQKSRDNAGQRALTDVDQLIQNLTEFRQRLADAITGQAAPVDGQHDATEEEIDAAHANGVSVQELRRLREDFATCMVEQLRADDAEYRNGGAR